MVWSGLEVRLSDRGACEIWRTLYVVWLKSTHLSTCWSEETGEVCNGRKKAQPYPGKHQSYEGENNNCFCRDG